MPESQMICDCYFFPVGQGLFSSTSIRTPNRYFHWVYDCGSTSKSSLIDLALDCLKDGCANIWPAVGTLQLVIISHFDADHVNGLVRLLDRFAVDILLLPYVPLWKRLLLAVQARVRAEDDFFAFYLDPAAYILGGDGRRRVRRILFVPSSHPDQPPPPREGGLPGEDEPPAEGEPPEAPEPMPFELEFEEADPPEGPGDEPMLTGIGAAQTGYLAPNTSLDVDRYWEFLPYNDAAQSPSDADFEARARELARTLLSRKDAPARTAVLEDLKELYRRNFGSSGEAKNIISLFISSGPLGDPEFIDYDLYMFKCDEHSEIIHYPSVEQYIWERRPAPRQIFTGDGYLNTCERFGAFTAFFGAHDRIKKTGIFQVMHHGADGNWHAGIADALRPLVSIFSSDPHHGGFGHPHADVLRDFWTYNPVQVDKDRGWNIFVRFDYSRP